MGINGQSELREKYARLLIENRRLRDENEHLKARLKLTQTGSSPGVIFPAPPASARASAPSIPSVSDICAQHNSAEEQKDADSAVDNNSSSPAKIRLFMSLFKGREDVYAERWENRVKGKKGYFFTCLNRWRPGICGKPKTACSECRNKSYAALQEKVIEDHLLGNRVVGIYPMLKDETCSFLAIDFDGANWQKDISALRQVCREFALPVAVERSRSGNGGHLWFFFTQPLAAALARKFGTALLTFAMNQRHEIKFNSYDRLFPNQDTMPKGGLGNLIALPLQKSARQNANSEFIDEKFNSYQDQWAFLSSIERVSAERLEHLVSELCQGHELGLLKTDEEEENPWEARKGIIRLQKTDFPEQIEIVGANMLFVPKKEVSARALNRLKRLASFQNPLFYKQQAMRLSTYGHPRVITCTDESKNYIGLPRGCKTELFRELESMGVKVGFVDKTCGGKKIDVEFKGRLRDEQLPALASLLQNDIGILSGTTAFGKTVVAIKLIAERKVNTLILVDRISLLNQWRERLNEFLTINEELPKPPPETAKKRGRKKKIELIGQLGGGKNTLSGIIDIAVMQSLSRRGEVKDCVKNYGLIIADECHHASAFTYEQILKNATAKYICGLTATPTRKDGHHPILLMHCGPIRFRDNPRKQAEKRPFDHYIIPRFTSLRTPLAEAEKTLSIQELYSEIVDNDFRNQGIIEDVLKNYHQGRNCLVLSLRTAHVERLARKLREETANVIILMGGMGRELTAKAFQRLAAIPGGENFVLVATGHFIGEGFDEPRLDTLFLAMPISWKGTLQQYAGRLHRLCDGKKEVRIYDYVDIQVRMLEKMYQKRLNGYAAMGYKAKGDEIADASPDIIFTQGNFLPVFNQDLLTARREIIIVSPFIRKMRSGKMLQHLQIPLEKGIRVVVVTRPPEDFAVKEQATVQEVLTLLRDSGVNIVFQSGIHQKFALMDQKIVWYGSINLLSYGSARESFMRIENANIANELMKQISVRQSAS